MKKNISLRLATIEDADLLLEWRNDPRTRKASHNIERVKKKDHISWLAQTLSDSNRKLYIAEEDGMAVGSVRADLSEGIWELSWTVSPRARGRGVAKRMVSVLANQIMEPIRAEVRTENIASAKVAKHAGMKFDYEIDGVLHYRRTEQGEITRNHTKLPWDVKQEIDHIRIETSEGDLVFIIEDYGSNDAAFMVKACNNHYFFTELFAKIEAENDIEKAKIYAREALSKMRDY